MVVGIEVVSCRTPSASSRKDILRSAVAMAAQLAVMTRFVPGRTVPRSRSLRMQEADERSSQCL